MASRQKILILAGGTGGHIIPALAVADYLRAQQVEIIWLGTQKGLEHELVPAAGIRLCYVTIQGVRGKGILGLLMTPYRMLKATWQAMKIIREEEPSVVVGFGGFVSAPGGLAAWLLRKPLIIHEQNSVAGLTNRLLARLATYVFQAFPDTFPKQLGAITSGNPVRSEIINLPPPEQRFQSHQGKLRVLVIGGSQGAKVFNEILPQVFAMLPENKQPEVWHSAGKHEVEQVKARYISAKIQAKVMPFIEDMASAYGWAELVICRAGALTIAELAAAGTASLLIPYPYAVDDHQTQNAAWLVNAGAGYMVQQTDFNLEKVQAILLTMLSEKDKLLEMAKAARSLALPEATKIVAERCLFS